MTFKTAFITGGSGFVGRNLIEELVRQNVTVRALARSSKAAETVQRLGAEAVSGDVDNTAMFEASLSGCEVVFHAAAQVGEWGDPRVFERVNVEGTRNLLNAAKRAGVKRFVHVSTEAVLVDDKPIIAADETRPRPERPIGLYPTTKGKAEALVQEMNSVEFQTVICRPRFIWGAGDTSVLPQFVEAVKSGRYMWFDGGRYLTSTCHVKNVCEGLILAAEKGRAGEIYFLTDGEPIEFRTFLTELLKTQGVTIADRSLPGWLAHVLATVSETVWTTFNLKGNPLLTRTTYYLMGREVTVKDAKARRELGYEGKVSRQQGLAEMASGQ